MPGSLAFHLLRLSCACMKQCWPAIIEIRRAPLLWLSCFLHPAPSEGKAHEGLSRALQVKIGELPLDTFRILQTLEWEDPAARRVPRLALQLAKHAAVEYCLCLIARRYALGNRIVGMMYNGPDTTMQGYQGLANSILVRDRRLGFPRQQLQCRLARGQHAPREPSQVPALQANCIPIPGRASYSLRVSPSCIYPSRLHFGCWCAHTESCHT